MNDYTFSDALTGETMIVQGIWNFNKFTLSISFDSNTIWYVLEDFHVRISKSSSTTEMLFLYNDIFQKYVADN